MLRRTNSNITGEFRVIMPKEKEKEFDKLALDSSVLDPVKHNLEFTRRAYTLNGIEILEMVIKLDIPIGDSDAINNIKLFLDKVNESGMSIGVEI